MVINEAMRRFARAKSWVQDGASDEDIRKALAEKLLSGALAAEVWALLVKNRDPVDGRNLLRDLIREELQGNGQRSGGLRPEHLRGTGAANLSTEKAVGLHRRTQQQVIGPDGNPCLRSSQSERYLFGCYMKRLAMKAGLPVGWHAGEEDALEALVEEARFVGQVGDRYVDGVGLRESKAVLDDTISGGHTLVPDFVDTMFISSMLLTGELLPSVTIRDVSGRTVVTPSLGQPTTTWGTPSGTAASLFDTTNLIGSISTSVFPVQTALEIGRDILSDSALNLGDALEKVIDQGMTASLETAIATGDGVTQPTGIFNTVGAVAVPAANGAAGPLTIADAEALAFGLSKQYRGFALNPSFVGSDVNYRRFRQIPTATGANDRVMGPTYSNYQVLEWPWRVAPSAPNNKLAFAALSLYRLYRRAAWEVIWESGGRELTLKNLSLLLVRGRFGGRFTVPAAVAMVSDAAA